ncbi:cytochrome P450 [Sporichthya polymorpha]|uniref:cytochrome P450 n=1 Tax=Sporichthya polymorpha TaxID=35751 RepID=UPI0003651868|nr:cytochrome P450 [Sporichthya polymorpha]
MAAPALPELDAPDLDTIDLSLPAVFADGPPHELFARLRAHAPVHRNHSRNPHVGDFWSITRAADIEMISKHATLFSAHERGIWMRSDAAGGLNLMRNMVIFKDPPDHTRYRKLVQVAFTPRTIAHLEDYVRARVATILDRAAATGSMDLVKDLSLPVPLAVITDLLGAPASDVDKLADWTARLDTGVDAPELGICLEAMMEMGGYLEELILGQIKGDSLVGLLARAEVDGDRLTEEELMMFFAILVFAGNDTTRNATSAGVLALTEHPDQLQALAADPSRIPNAVEEILRWSTPLNYFARTALEDTEIRGVPIAAGDLLLMWYASGSRDEEVLPGADRFDVLRPVEYHQAFGGGGRHFCLGAGLARLELKVIFEEFTRRVRDPRLSGPVVRHCTTWVNGYDSIPLTFTPA